ncbi:hypothetical protein Csa_004601 [Cucumis sativus]|uniref:Uncharacterized protein n=1 Tax=Cucumis sativus TaxID=3659 RepID=A0A0A0KWQ6_CUCSA|nr:hypothetical protein Csa_004601 [Cucumis sativus]
MRNGVVTWPGRALFRASWFTVDEMYGRSLDVKMERIEIGGGILGLCGDGDEVLELWRKSNYGILEIGEKNI